MATIVPTPSGTHKALVRMKGLPHRLQDFPPQARRHRLDTPNRGRDGTRRLYIAQRLGAHGRQKALERYLEEVTPTKKPTTQRREKITAQHLTGFPGKYSMAALSSEFVASYRDIESGRGNPITRSVSSWRY